MCQPFYCHRKLLILSSNCEELSRTCPHICPQRTSSGALFSSSLLEWSIQAAKKLGSRSGLASSHSGFCPSDAIGRASIPSTLSDSGLKHGPKHQPVKTSARSLWSLQPFAAKCKQVAAKGRLRPTHWHIRTDLKNIRAGIEIITDYRYSRR